MSGTLSGNIVALTLIRQRRNPMRMRRFDFAISNGDDVKMQVTVYDRETDPMPLNVGAARWQMAFWPADRRGWGGYGWCDNFEYDYGWPIYQGQPGNSPGAFVIGGIVVNGQGGVADLWLPYASTSLMFGRYRYSLQLQMPSGISTSLSGDLEVFPSAGLTPVPYNGFDLGVSTLGGPDILGGANDPDGFPMLLAGTDGDPLLGSDGSSLVTE